MPEAARTGLLERPFEECVAGLGIGGGVRQLVRRGERRVADDARVVLGDPRLGELPRVPQLVALKLRDAEDHAAARVQQLEDGVEVLRRRTADRQHGNHGIALPDPTKQAKAALPALLIGLTRQPRVRAAIPCRPRPPWSSGLGRRPSRR